jgi:hypothetical protein
MGFILHKEIFLKKNIDKTSPISFFVHGKLIGWTDGENTISHKDVLNEIKNKWIDGGSSSVADFMRGVVGPCILEISDKNNSWFYASCASGGFYWITQPGLCKNELSFFVSNDEGNFFRKAFKVIKKISEGSIINAIFSHQSVIRPPFAGLVSETKKCPPGFYVYFNFNGDKLYSYLIDKKKKKRKQQDLDLIKKLNAITFLYKSYFQAKGAISKLAFSGGVDSTVLLIYNKDVLDRTSHGFYIDRGKIAEKKMALEIGNYLRCKIHFTMPHKDFSFIEIKKKAESGLAIFNGIVYMKHGFQFSPYNQNSTQQVFILNGQNSDTMFHIDTFSPSSSATGIYRMIKMSKGIYLRFQTTLTYYYFQKIFLKKKSFKFLPPGVEKTLYNFDEHGSKNIDLPKNIKLILRDYKKNNFITPTIDWFNKEFYPKLYQSELDISEKYNHGARLARWLRTIANFHQQFNNISNSENFTMLTPYSEGPMATELLSYRLGFFDTIFPKRFLHKLIENKLGKSYSKIRNQALDGDSKSLIFKLIYYLQRSIEKLKKKICNSKNQNHKISTSKITKKDLFNLREILGHKDGVVDRFIITLINDKDCIKYIDYLYDCIELKVDTNALNENVGTQLCRLVNLQIMLLSKN